MAQPISAPHYNNLLSFLFVCWLTLKISISTRLAWLTAVQLGSPPLRWSQTLFVQKNKLFILYTCLISILEYHLTSICFHKDFVDWGPSLSDRLLHLQLVDWGMEEDSIVKFSYSHQVWFFKLRLVILVREGQAMAVLCTLALRL